MDNNIEIVTKIAKRIAELLEHRVILAECTDFNDHEMVAGLERVSDEIKELMESADYYTCLDFVERREVTA